MKFYDISQMNFISLNHYFEDILNMYLERNYQQKIVTILSSFNFAYQFFQRGFFFEMKIQESFQ